MFSEFGDDVVCRYAAMREGLCELWEADRYYRVKKIVRHIIGREQSMSIATDSSSNMTGNNVRVCAFLERRTLFLRKEHILELFERCLSPVAASIGLRIL